MIRWSLALGILGILTTGLAVISLNRRGAQQSWLLGLGALFPAWLVAFLGQLTFPSDPMEGGSLPASAVLSSGAALLGIIFSDMAVRRLEKSRHLVSPLWRWLLGVAALVPAWCIALLV